MPIASPGYHLCFWPSGYKSEVPTTPSLGSVNLLEWLIELGRTVTFISLLKDMTKDTVEQPFEEIYRVSSSRVPSAGASVSEELGVHHSPGMWMCSSTWKLFEPPTLGIFMKALSHRHDQLLLHFQLLSPLWRRGRGQSQKFQASDHGLVILVTSPHPGAHPELPQNKRCC